MNPSSEREETLFAEALARPAPKRAAFLDQACGADSALRARLTALLAAHEEPETALGPPAAPTAEEQPGDRIDRYRLLQKIGEGGCGVVYLAEQFEPVHRRVALKVIKLGMDTKEVIARFEAERQALALMDHPNIAHVFDAGTTASGRPYFVMELVSGVRITDYCDEHKLTTAQRLKLAIQVCHAVQHAHQKGIIHRDLKPSNILVAHADDEPTPKVIDFGIAKATQGRLTERTLFTAFERFIGTPAYMCPEQAALTGLDIDTRADIYSLGVLLYELLTGHTPFDPQSLVRAGLDEIRRLIREVDPPKPSARLSTMDGDKLSSTAHHRHTEPPKLINLVRGDLDWIVMKAMEKDRSRRYETPTALAADLLRHLHHEPVVARPPSAAYRTGKFIRRHRLGFAATTAVAFALVAGTIVSTWQAVRATRAERRAEIERRRADDLHAFMMGALYDRLYKVGRLDVLEGVGDKALAFFATLDARDLDDATRLREARALRQKGEVRMKQGRIAEALEDFSEAFRRTAALALRHPRDGDYLFERALAESWIGIAHRKHGDLAMAAEWLTRSNETNAAVATLGPPRPAWQDELASGQHNLAVLRLDRGEFAAARADFLAELATRERMSADAPNNLEFRQRIADVHSWLGAIAVQQGDFAEALHRYARRFGLVEDIARHESPPDPRWQFKLAEARLLQIDVLLATGQVAPAGDGLLEARRLLDELVAHDPANREWLASQQHCRLLEAMLARKQGDFVRALRLVGEARPQFEKLAAADKASRKYILRLMTAWRLEAQLCADTGRPGALPAATTAIKLGTQLIAEQRGADADVGACALAGVVAGEIAARAGDAVAARRHWQWTVDLLAPRLRPDTSNWQLLDPAARAALLLDRANDARALISRLSTLGYTPLDPWPNSPRSSEP